MPQLPAQIRNSVLQMLNGVGTAALNFILVFVYARWLGPERFGQFVASQSQVLVWLILVDLGITTGLIGALHQMQKNFERGDRNSLPEHLLRQTLLVRWGGSVIGVAGIAILSELTHGGSSALTRDLAFCPHLFAYASQYTMTSYLAFRNRLSTTVFANIAGVLAANTLTFLLVLNGASVPVLLFSQSWGGFLAAIIMRLSIRMPPARHRIFSRSKNPSASSAALRELWIHSWPNFVILAAITLWSRLDQVIATRWLGYAVGAQYSLAVKLVAVPALMISSIQFALFSDLQRLGHEAPKKISVFSGGLAKLWFRYGILLSAVVLLGLGYGLLPFLAKFRAAVELLPAFLPGTWAYGAYILLSTNLLAVRNYGAVVRVHLISLAFYLLALPLLTYWAGVNGTVLSYNLFPIVLAVLCHHTLKSAGVLNADHRFWGQYTSEESELIVKLRSRISSVAWS